MAPKSVTKQELQHQGRDLNLDTRGTKAALQKRLNEHAANAAASDPADEASSAVSDTQCDAVLATRIEMEGEEEMAQAGQQALQQEPDENQPEVQETRGTLAVGNRRGLNIVAQLVALGDSIAALQQEIAALQQENAAQYTMIWSLQGQVAGLTLSLDSYKGVRNRFISTYKRDVLKRATDADRLIIASGSASAHGGDAAADALLYTQGLRKDYHIYRKLYGIDPGVVGSISERHIH